MAKIRTNPAAGDPAVEQEPERPPGHSCEDPLPDAFIQIRDARDRIVAAVIERAVKDGSYQHAKWLFEFGGIVPGGPNAPEKIPRSSVRFWRSYSFRKHRKKSPLNCPPTIMP